MEKNTNNPSEIDINSIIKPYLSKWYWFVVFLFLAIFLAIVYIKTAVTVYHVQSAVLIKDAKKSIGGAGGMGVLEGLSGFGGMSTNSIENELEVFKTKKLARDVASINHLQTTLLSNSFFTKKELFGDTSPIIVHIINEKKNKEFPKKPFTVSFEKGKVNLKSEEFNFNKTVEYGRSVSLPFANIIITKNKAFDREKAKEINKELELSFSSLESAASDIQKLIQVDLADKDGTIISLGVNYPETDKAKTILKSLVDSYNKDAIVDKNSESHKTKEFIDDRIDKISGELGNVESEKERFKTDHKITDLMTEAKINLESSADAKKKQLELDAQLELTNDLISYLNKQNTNQLLPVNVGLESQESNTDIAAYNKMVLDRNRLLENATPQNPLVQDISQQINSMKRSVSESLQKNKLALQLALNEYVSEQSKIGDRITKIPHQEKLFRSLERQQQIKENLYLLLLQKREETAISLAVVAPKARVVEPAYIADKPVAPKKMIILLVSMILGVLIPFVLIYLKELINTKISSKDDLKSLTAIPVVAEIPAIRKNVDHVIKHNDFSQLAESFRILTTNIGFMLPKIDNGKVIFVTSSIKGEGKTFVSMNLALSLSYSNERVVIIGADIRNPQLQRYNNGKNPGKGLSEFLYDKNTTLDEITFKNPVNNKCDIIYSGTIPPNPTELLKNGRLSALLDDLRLKYDYIIVDTAPLLLVTDTFTFVNYADLKLYVTRSNFTDKKLIDFANDSVESGKLDNVAFVLNDVTKQNFGYGNKYGYGYNNK
ncbi:GumC family protein [Epilithonimonas xixisoli]|uniref:non-specific protein-tyrosine kinase n=1 Tax=Epilithonimonas xixisoli TaxID=1476462 RepID=A0A4R8I3Y6_9FLAO|nr:polysaccharide biosynthesis tyrosine autokinase [Epilithonimonas xixisoli]TDX83014.1 capsular exopolysaccharide synthesis family protein [Epilithonimonas xixisoli]